jgi:hypothetical protein
MGLQWRADHGTRVLGQRLPVGAAVPGCEVVLLDAAGRESAGAWRGEIGLISPYLAAGYDGDEALSARRFVPLADGRRLLRTGDLARRLPDGELLYEGRCDRQVKLRGVRIEPGEIEAALTAVLELSECVVVAREEASSGEVSLVAYLVGSAAPGEGELRRRLRELLPEALIPAAFVWLKRLPRRGNGKVEEARLPAPAAALTDIGAAPRSEIERRLEQIWCALLGREAVGVHDDFFALGGHSLLATRLIARVRDAFALEVPLLAVFENPTLRGLAGRIEALGSAGTAMVPRIARLQRSAGREK